jgi:tetratricopeptide (TPR) repeat protein
LKDYQRLVFEVTGLGMESDGLSFWDLWEEFNYEAEHEKKRELALKLLKWGTNHADQILQKGFFALDFLKQPGLAVEQFDQVITLRPDDERGYSARASALFEIGDYLAAISDLKKGLGSIFFKANAYNNIANCYFRLGELDLALSSIKQALELDSDDAIFNLSYADIQSALGLTEGFYASLEIALSSDPRLFVRLELQTVLRHQDDPRFQAIIAKYRPDFPLNPST